MCLGELEGYDICMRMKILKERSERGKEGLRLNGGVGG